MAWLRGHDRSLASCTQGDIDLWLTGAPVRRHAAEFVSWAVKRRLASGLKIKTRQASMPTRVMSSDEQTRLVQRFLTDASIALLDRVAGLLLCCYAQPLSKIVKVQVGDIETRDGHEWIRFGNSPVKLASSIATLTRELCENPGGRATTGRPAAKVWLFPGSRPGTAICAETLGRRLGVYGINARDARTTAMLDLGSELAPAVLADMIGVVPNTAVRWVHAAGGDWSSYAAQRSRA